MAAKKKTQGMEGIPPGTAYISVVRFTLDEKAVTADVHIFANGCPGVKDGWRSREFPPTTNLQKLGDYVAKMKGKSHPKFWKMG